MGAGRSVNAAIAPRVFWVNAWRIALSAGDVSKASVQSWAFSERRYHTAVPLYANKPVPVRQRLYNREASFRLAPPLATIGEQRLDPIMHFDVWGHESPEGPLSIPAILFSCFPDSLDLPSFLVFWLSNLVISTAPPALLCRRSPNFPAVDALQSIRRAICRAFCETPGALSLRGV